MSDDPILRELRETRKIIETECKKKGQSYFAHLLEIQENYKEKLTEHPRKSQVLKEKTA